MKSVKQYIKPLLTESVIYGLSGIVTSFISIFLIPIYTRIFTPYDYGIIGLLTTTSTLISMFIIFGLDNSVALWYWDKPSEEERRKTINAWYYFMGALSAVIGLVFVGFSAFFSELILNTPKYSLLVKIFGFNLVITCFQRIANMWFRIRREAVKAVIYSLFISLLIVALNLLLVVKLRWGLYGSFYSQLIGSAAGFIVITVILYKNLSLRYFDLGRLKEMIKFSAPLIPASLAFWFMSSASTYFVNLYVADKSEIGLYQVANSVTAVLSLGSWAFLQAWSPFALSISKDEKAKNVYSYVLEFYCLIGFFIACMLSMFAKDILTIFTTEKYLGARYVIGILGFNVIVSGIPQILGIGNALAKNNVSYVHATFIGSAITVGLFNALIPLMGKEGAAAAILIGNVISVTYMAVKTQKLYYVDYKFGRMVFIFLFFFGGSILVHFFEDMRIGFWQTLVLKFSLVFGMALLFLNLYARHLPLHVRQMSVFKWLLLKSS